MYTALPHFPQPPVFYFPILFFFLIDLLPQLISAISLHQVFPTNTSQQPLILTLSSIFLFHIPPSTHCPLYTPGNTPFTPFLSTPSIMLLSPYCLPYLSLPVSCPFCCVFIWQFHYSCTFRALSYIPFLVSQRVMQCLLNISMNSLPEHWNTMQQIKRMR